ncbi:MAG TPA: hypothetical protein VM580_03400, partial [Labilithrix sp.]|nr:hypothetical protein [Labilithrix sp.]
MQTRLPLPERIDLAHQGVEVREGERTTLVRNDIVGNLTKDHGIVLRALGFATERPQVPRLAKRAMVKVVHD